MEIIEILHDEEKILQEIGKLSKDIIPQASKKIRKNISIKIIKNNLNRFLDFEGVEKQENIFQLIDKMSLKNADLLRNVDFRILDKKYIGLLGEDKVNLISCLPGVQKRIIGLNDRQLNVFAKCIDTYLKERTNEDEWTVLAVELLDHIGEYDELIDNIETMEKVEEQDVLKLIQVLQGENYCNIKNMDEARNYDKILKKKTIEKINNDTPTLEEKRNAVFWKIFGHDMSYAYRIINLFGEGIENLNDGEMKYYVKALIEISNIQSEDVLKEIFESCHFAQIDKVSVQRNLKNEYGKKFNEGLYQPGEKKEKYNPWKLQDKDDLISKIGINKNIENEPTEKYASKKADIYKDIEPQIKLNEIIEKAKGLEELFDKAEEVQAQNHSTSPVHGAQHVKNVLLISNYIGLREGVSQQDLEIIREASIYHDIEHKKAADSRHAKDGAEWYLQNIDSNLNKEEVAYLIEAHEFKSDKQFSDLINNRFPSITEKRKAELIKCAKILQDADRLDILRYDIENPISQRFQPDRLNYRSNTELISAVIELNTREAITKGYLQIDENEGEIGLNKSIVIEAGTDFKILMTAVGAFSGVNPENYKEDWNRPALASQHFCASYIRNDMIRTAPIKNVCYGFCNMKDDALVLSGSGDIYSSRTGFVSYARHNEKYYTPDEQINNTVRYNEMDFRRIQGGEKKQPDYLLVFRKYGTIKNMQEAMKASEQWGGMPIVVVDIDACLEAEKAKVTEMLSTYKENPTPELAKDINQKVRNNRVTERSFCKDLEEQLKILRAEVEKVKSTPNKINKQTEENCVDLESIKEISDGVSAVERSKVEKIKHIYQTIKRAKEEQNNGR